MKRLLTWLKTVNQNANKRAKLILAAREIMSNMDEHWQAANKSNDDVAAVLMVFGLAQIKAIYGEQLAMQNMIQSRKAHLN
jgi:hypothetical protein